MREDCLQAYAQPRIKAGEGSKRALGFDAADSPGQADAAVVPKSAEGSEADLREMLGARDELMNRWRHCSGLTLWLNEAYQSSLMQHQCTCLNSQLPEVVCTMRDALKPCSSFCPRPGC